VRGRIVPILGGLLIGAAIGGVVRSTQPIRVPILRAEKQPASSFNEGGDSLITVELEPNAILKQGAVEQLEYQLDINPRANAKSNVAIQYSTEIVGDDGTQLQPPAISPAVSVAASSGHSQRVTTPPGTRDGYFVMRIQAAGSDGTEDTLEVIERYFRVKGGAMIPVTPDEYFENSNAHVARSGP